MKKILLVKKYLIDLMNFKRESLSMNVSNLSNL